MEKRYEICGKTYVQRPVVLGQFNLLLPVLKGLEISGGSAVEVAFSLGEGLHKALAVVLIEEGQTVRDACRPECLLEREADIQWAIDPEVVVEVIEDFFECNPISSISEKIGNAMSKLNSRLSVIPGTLNPLSTDSPKEMSASGMELSGGPGPESPSHGSTSMQGKRKRS
jgi:hypothetical protein